MTAVVGSEINRVEGADKVSGRAHYTADVDIPNVTYASLVQSEIPHGEVIEESLKRSVDKAFLLQASCMYSVR